MTQRKGVELIDETEGSGEPAKKADEVVFNIRIFLNKGDEVPINEKQTSPGLPEAIIRRDGDRVFVEHRMVLGKRHVIPGIEHSLIGMRPSGYRKVRISPHLAYGERGIPGLIPANALLVVEIWLRQVITET